MLIEACQKSRPRKGANGLQHHETSSPAFAASLEGTERNHKWVRPGNTRSGPPAPSLEDLGRANVDVPLSIDCVSPAEQNRGHMTGFGETDCDHLLRSDSRVLKFDRWAVTREKPE